MKIISDWKKLLCAYFKIGILSATILFIIPNLGVGQEGPPIFGDDMEQKVPIDGGLGILAALGGTYALKKLRDKKE